MKSKNGVSWVLQRHDVDRTIVFLMVMAIVVIVSDKYIFVSSSYGKSHRGKKSSIVIFYMGKPSTHKPLP